MAITALVFDTESWGFKDVGDNSQFWRLAEIWDVKKTTDTNDLVATVHFLHDGRVSHGHFVNCMNHNQGIHICPFCRNSGKVNVGTTGYPEVLIDCTSPWHEEDHGDR